MAYPSVRNLVKSETNKNTDHRQCSN